MSNAEMESKNAPGHFLEMFLQGKVLVWGYLLPLKCINKKKTGIDAWP